MEWQGDLVTPEFISYILTEGLLLSVGVLLLVKGLLFQRRDELGSALAQNNIAMALAYISTFFAQWVPALRHPWLSVILRIIIVFTATRAIFAFVEFYGGWRATGRELMLSILEMRGTLAHLILSCMRFCFRRKEDSP